MASDSKYADPGANPRITDFVLEALDGIGDDVDETVWADQATNWLLSYVRPMVAEVRRLRGLLADLASDHMRISTERMQAVGEALNAIEDVLATSHITKTLRTTALASLKELRRVYNAESKSPPASVVEHNERIRAKEAGNG